MKLKIPAVNGKITDEEIAKIIAEKTIVEDEEGSKKTTVKDWIVRGDHVIVEIEKFKGGDFFAFFD